MSRKVVAGMLVMLATVLQVVVQGAVPHATIDGLGQAPGRYCLACLCSAASGCDLKKGCLQDEPNAICGPFYMSRPFWLDANITALPQFREHDFVRCATDEKCAAAAVVSYMTKFSRDCDGDGRVTCKDHGLMHYLGYTGCTSPWQRQQAEESTFFGTFMRCLEEMDRLLVAGVMTQMQHGCQS